MVNTMFEWLPLILVNVWGLIGSMRASCVSGTHRRYVFNTLERALRLPSLIYVAAPGIQYIFAEHTGSRLAMTLVGTLFSVVIWRWYDNSHRRDDRDDDDDDWFKKAGKRLKRWVRNNVRVRVRVLSPVKGNS